MTSLDGSRSAELPNVCSASSGPIEALLDAVAFVLNEWEGQDDISDDTSDIETLDVYEMLATMQKGSMEEHTSDAAFISHVEIGADTFLGVIITFRDRTRQSGGGEEKSWDNGSEMHVDLRLDFKVLDK